MKKWVWALVIVTFSSFAIAEENYKHMVIFGTDYSAGWSGAAGRADVDSKLGIDEYNISNGNFQINYAYAVAPQFQVGVLIDSEKKSSEVKAKAGGKITSDETSSSVLLFGLYNLSDNLSDSFYLGGGFGKGYINNEDKDTTGGTVDKTKTKYDSDVLFATFGKRFNLKGLGIQNLSYSPSIMYVHQKINGDLEDSGVNSISYLQLDLVKFDLLF